MSTWLVIAGKGVVKVTPEGHFRGAPEIDQELIVVAETDAGEQVTLSLAEFEKKYGWKNDPERAISAPFETTAALLKPDDHNPGHREPGESPVVAKADDRRAAEWVLSIGGDINIIQNGEGRMIAVADDLPRGAFQLDAVGLGNNQKVSDAGLAHFADCPTLAFIHVTNTKVTEAGVKKLAAALPGCKIEWDGGVIEPMASADPD